ncbi:MAG: acetate--CoA ligase family protein [Myxococcales bacterium]|nr:acetate--CoA ligase family protein [Myxococcales bacterium]
MATRIICDCAELAVEIARAAAALTLRVEPQVRELSLPAACEGGGPQLQAVCLSQAPRLEQLVELANSDQRRAGRTLLALVGHDRDAMALAAAAADLGITMVREVEPLASALSLLNAGAAQAWTASARALGRSDRRRLQRPTDRSTRDGGLFEPADDGYVLWKRDADSAGVNVGAARDLAVALEALAATDRETPMIESSVEGVDEGAVLDVLLGPRRSLSDPASKAALAPYGIPLPLEELCGSASRAAAEASRIGYPVRISLASPDLRLWDHPDLAVDMVDSASRVRDTYRQLMGLAKTRLERPGEEAERILGVMVTATGDPLAALGIRAWPLPHGRVGMELGFADPHGAASADRTLAVLPAPLSVIERVLGRLAGQSLLLGVRSAQRKVHVEAIGDVLLRLSAFVNDRRHELESVELKPLSLLLDGSVEVREACVRVSDAFEQSLQRRSV